MSLELGYTRLIARTRFPKTERLMARDHFCLIKSSQGDGRWSPFEIQGAVRAAASPCCSNEYSLNSVSCRNVGSTSVWRAETCSSTSPMSETNESRPRSGIRTPHATAWALLVPVHRSTTWTACQHAGPLTRSQQGRTTSVIDYGGRGTHPLVEIKRVEKLAFMTARQVGHRSAYAHLT